jgi:hypothetical protein
MPTIRIHEWTKEKLKAVREEESHSSYDSVVKALLRDRKLAQLSAALGEPDFREADDNDAIEKEFDDLTVLAELSTAKEGVMFLWCPNCGNEVAHIVAENPVSMSVFEIQCQQCLSELTHHALVTVEIGYPVEKKVVEGTLQTDLRQCIIDYWDRMLTQIGTGSIDEAVDDEHLIWQFFQYDRTFNWEWPAETAVVGLTAGETYLNRSTEQYLEIVEPIDEHQSEFGPFHVETWAEKQTRGDATESVLEPEAIRQLLTNRVLYRVTD